MKGNLSSIFSSRTSHLLLLILAALLVFSNTLNNAYHLDSIYRVKNNTEINQFWPASRFFTDKRTGSTIPQIAEYRPMMPLTHAINSEISKATGTSKLSGFHVGNLVIHIGSAILVYYLFILLISNWGVGTEFQTSSRSTTNRALVAALIFAIHPIAGSAVNYIAGRDLVLMVFFFNAFMLRYFSMRRSGDTLSGWGVSLLLLCLAILSKQNAIMAFGLIFLFEWMLMKVKLRNWRLWARTACVAVPTAAFFLLHQIWISDQDSIGSLRIVDGLTYPLTMLDAHLFYYARNFVWPFEMRALAGIEMVKSIAQPSALIGLGFIVLTLLTAWLFRIKQPLITFGIMAYWLLFSLTSSIFPFRYVVTDYRQYLPLVFLALVFTMLVYSADRKILSISIFSALIIYFSVASYHNNTHWKTEESFWQQSVKYGAQPLAHQNYGLAIAHKSPDLAEHHYLEALRQNPNHIYANINLAMLHINMGKQDDGLARLERMVISNPDWALSHYWLSRGLMTAGHEEKALPEIMRAADLDKRSIRYQYEAALALQKAGKVNDAIPYYLTVMKLNPDYKITGFWLGFAYQRAGQSQNAIETYRHFLQLHPTHAQGHFNLAYELMTQNNCKEAAMHFNQVLKLKPDYREVHLHLSGCYTSIGNAPLAAEHLSLYEGSGRLE